MVNHSIESSVFFFFSANISIDDNAQLTSIELDALESVEYGVFIGQNPVLTQLRLPALTSAGGDCSFCFFSIRDNPLLTEVELDALRSVVGTVAWKSNRSLTSLPLPSLVGVGSLEITDHAGLTAIELAALQTVGERLEVARNPLLTRLAFPALAAGDAFCSIRESPALCRSTVAAQSALANCSIGGIDDDC